MTDPEKININEAKELLLQAMETMNVTVLNVEGNYIDTINDYRIEIEGNSLFKLMCKGYVVAPFADVVELCGFIKLG